MVDCSGSPWLASGLFHCFVPSLSALHNILGLLVASPNLSSDRHVWTLMKGLIATFTRFLPSPHFLSFMPSAVIAKLLTVLGTARRQALRSLAQLHNCFATLSLSRSLAQPIVLTLRFNLGTHRCGYDMTYPFVARYMAC